MSYDPDIGLGPCVWAGLGLAGWGELWGCEPGPEQPYITRPGPIRRGGDEQIRPSSRAGLRLYSGPRPNVHICASMAPSLRQCAFPYIGTRPSPLSLYIGIDPIIENGIILELLIFV